MVPSAVVGRRSRALFHLRVGLNSSGGAAAVDASGNSQPRHARRAHGVSSLQAVTPLISCRPRHCYQRTTPRRRSPRLWTASSASVSRPTNIRNIVCGVDDGRKKVCFRSKSETAAPLTHSTSLAQPAVLVSHRFWINRRSNFSSSSGGGSGGGESDSALLRMLGPHWSAYGRLARIDKPAGTMLLLFPCWWSIALAAPMGSLPDPKFLALFGAGAVLMRSAGCTINDLWDKDLDGKVARTKDRPLASGELGTMQAIAFLGGQLTLGLGVLLSLNLECIKLGFAVMPLVVAYPLMKRYTDWPQAVLGLTFNWGAIMGWVAVQGSASWEHVLPLYGAGVCWTLVYDTLYGHQDKADDKRLGIRSTALLFGDRTKPILAGFGVASVGLLATSGLAAGLSWPFYVGTAAAAGHLARQIHSADLDNPAGLFKIFRSNQEFGALIFASIVCGHF